jgi:hypothetical protein
MLHDFLGLILLYSDKVKYSQGRKEILKTSELDTNLEM